MNRIQGILHAVEEGKAQILTRLIPSAIALLLIFIAYDMRIFEGFTDAQSMDNAQLARQIATGAGYTTKFIRPYAIEQFSQFQRSKSSTATELYPSDRYPRGTPRILPDSYNAPGYPYLLAGWFKLVHPAFDPTARQLSGTRVYGPDKFPMLLNQLFLCLTAVLVFLLARRLFDSRVAWLSVSVFLLTNLVWQYSITALSTSALMFLLCAALFIVLEIFSVGEICFESTEATFWPAWLWSLLLVLVLAAACLMRLHLLVLLVPLAVFLFCMPSRRIFLPFLVVLIVLGLVAPWFLHLYEISGSPVGSNVPILHYGTPDFEGNQIFCTLTPPNYDQLFKDATAKEFMGLRWHILHIWTLLGTNPFVLLFFVSFLHNFRQARAQALRWLLLGSATVLVLANNLGSPHPDDVDQWNVLILLLPGMIVVGSAFFCILLDRLHLPLRIFNGATVTVVLVLTAAPLIANVFDTRTNQPYPPYAPTFLRAIGDIVPKENWIATDMPWAEAWYGNHTSLWLPDSVSDFNEIYDTHNSSAVLVLTQVLENEPATTILTGEYKDWLPFVTGGTAPPGFPLSRAVEPKVKDTIGYSIWQH